MSKLDLSQPIYLQYNGNKFWEISLNAGNKTSIRYGKLVLNVEVEDKVSVVEKVHKNYDDCRDYITRVVEAKILKGYQGIGMQKKKESPPMIVINGMQEVLQQVEPAPIDSTHESCLMLNKSWKATFALLTCNKKKVVEISGQIGLKKTWTDQTVELSSEQTSLKYFEDRRKELEAQAYIRADEQYHSLLQEYNAYAESKSVTNSQGLTLPMRGRQNKDDDSHSNVSACSKNSNSRNTNLDVSSDARSNGGDLSFDAKSNASDGESSQASVRGNYMIPGKLGKSGKLEGGVLLAEQVPEDMDPTGWIGSEKMDGVRAVWTGSTFYSRNGNEFYAPSFFTARFPKCTLDGELFTKRDDFQRCVGIVKTQNKNKDPALDARWKEIVYLVYDAPFLKKPFKDRIAALQEELPKVDSNYIRVLPHITIRDREHLDEQLENTLAKSGEGIMLRDPNAMYEQRRSKTLLKVKVFTDDEAIVTGIERGEGRCAGMMGAINCRMKNGVEFKIGSGFNDTQRRNPPKIGSTVTFKYQNLSKNLKPRFPIFLRMKVGSDF